MDRKLLGREGEILAAEFLVRKGYRELARNLTLKQGEIDLLMEDGDTVVLAEVKAQTSATLIDPVYKISPAKRRKLALLASIVSARYPERNVRIDAVTIYWNRSGKPVITQYENI